MKHFIRSCTMLLLLCVFARVSLAQSTAPPKMLWYRGNTHTHTVNNDGNAAPDTVVRWYREHGYHFIFITDHEFLTDDAPLNALYGAPGKFLVMRGQEVTQMLADPTHEDGLRHAHANGLGLNRVVMPVGSDVGPLVSRGLTMSETYVRNVAAVRAAGGIPQINHPNLGWSVKPEDLAAVSGPFLLEIVNAWPLANNLGGTDDQGNAALSAEAFWDVLLGQNKTAWAVASDDSHDYLHMDDFSSERPGKAWIVVRAAELTSAAILESLLKGDFYASNGVALADYVVDRTSVAITIDQPRHAYVRGNLPIRDNRRFMTRFTGAGGRVLAELSGLRPKYVFRGDEGYVRASITDSNGLRAWTQPVFLTAARGK